MTTQLHVSWTDRLGWWFLALAGCEVELTVRSASHLVSIRRMPERRPERREGIRTAEGRAGRDPLASLTTPDERRVRTEDRRGPIGVPDGRVSCPRRGRWGRRSARLTMNGICLSLVQHADACEPAAPPGRRPGDLRHQDRRRRPGTACGAPVEWAALGVLLAGLVHTPPHRITVSW